METMTLERKSVRPYETKDEYVLAMTEDLAEWLNVIYKLKLEANNFFECIDDGILLCKHANYVSSLLFKDLPYEQVIYRNAVKRGTFAARDNISNFICWCRDILMIASCMLFETNDLVLRSSERSVILCLLEMARKGARLGIVAPLIVQMEVEIDAEISAAKLKRSNSKSEKNPEPTPTKINTKYSNRPDVDLRSLDEMVRDLVKRCTCPRMFPMQRLSEGRYKIGDSLTNIFVRILRYHVMVRIGGGWDTLEHYLNRHDPCRCKEHSESDNPKSLQRSSVFCNGDDVDYSKVQSRIDSGSSRQFKAAVKSVGVPSMSSCKSNHRRMSSSLDTQPKLERDANLTFGSRKHESANRPPATPRTPSTDAKMTSPQSTQSRRRPHNHGNAKKADPRPHSPNAIVLRRSAAGRHSLATPISTAAVVGGGGGAVPVLRSPCGSSSQRRRTQSTDFKILPDAPSLSAYSSSESERGAPTPGSRSSNAVVARQLEALRRGGGGGGGGESNDNLGTPKADAELSKRMQKLFDEYSRKEIYGGAVVPLAGTPRTESSRRAAVERISRARAEKSAKQDASKTPLMGRLGSRVGSRVGSTVGSRVGSRVQSRVGSRSCSRAGSVVGADCRISRPNTRSSSKAESRDSSVSKGRGDGDVAAVGVSREQEALPTPRRIGCPTSALRPRFDKASRHQPRTRIPGPAGVVETETPFPLPGAMKRYDSGVDINNVSPNEGSLINDDVYC